MSLGTPARALRLALIGDPVEHSLSPSLQAEFLAKAAREGSYEAIRIPAGEGARGIADLRARGYAGLNVTTPLKEEAYAASDRVAALADQLGAVNTLVLTEQAVYGFNTDGAGAIGAVTSALGVSPHDLRTLRMLVLGAGPTARAVACSLAPVAAHIAVWNRTPEKAEALARTARGSVRVWDGDPSGEPFDVAFSTLSPEVEPPALVRAALTRARAVIDANYGPRATLGARLGRSVDDGVSMLRASAAASFGIWASDPTDGDLHAMTHPRSA